MRDGNFIRLAGCTVLSNFPYFPSTIAIIIAIHDTGEGVAVPIDLIAFTFLLACMLDNYNYCIYHNPYDGSAVGGRVSVQILFSETENTVQRHRRKNLDSIVFDYNLYPVATLLLCSICSILLDLIFCTGPA